MLAVSASAPVLGLRKKSWYFDLSDDILSCTLFGTGSRGFSPRDCDAGSLEAENGGFAVVCLVRIWQYETCECGV